MSAPILWIAFPFLAAIGLWFLRFRPLLASVLAALISTLLAGLAALLPIGGVISIGPLVASVPDTLIVLGRRFILAGSDSSWLVLIYAFGAFWFVGSTTTNTRIGFPAYGLGMIALMVSALAVEPFLFSALVIEIVMLFSIPMLVVPNQRPGQGLLRYLIFFTLGMPFILLAGSVLGSVDIISTRQQLIQQAALLLGLGFAFWLAVFPFYAWVPLLANETSPYVAGFVLSLLTTVIFFLGLGFLNEFTWLRSNSGLYDILRITGTVMMVTASFWAAFQTDLARLMGYAVIFETGFALLAISLQSSTGLVIFSAAILSRLLMIGVWSLALNTLRSAGISGQLDHLQGRFSEVPFSSTAIVFACFSCGGLPLLAAFPIRIGLAQSLSVNFPLVALLALMGSAGFLVSGFRLLTILAGNSRLSGQGLETRAQRALLGIGIAVIVVIGILPGIGIGSMQGLIQAFPNLP